jgi:anti-sigma factor RsiW
MTAELRCQGFVELVTDYFDGALPQNERARMEAHLGICDGCAAYLEQLRLTVRTLGDLPPEPVDLQTRERLLSVFRELRG